MSSSRPAYAAKYDEMFGFRIADGHFNAPDSPDPDGVVVYAVHAQKAFGFGKGTSFSQTRWRFSY